MTRCLARTGMTDSAEMPAGIVWRGVVTTIDLPGTVITTGSKAASAMTCSSVVPESTGLRAAPAMIDYSVDRVPMFSMEVPGSMCVEELPPRSTAKPEHPRVHEGE